MPEFQVPFLIKCPLLPAHQKIVGSRKISEIKSYSTNLYEVPTRVSTVKTTVDFFWGYILNIRKIFNLKTWLD